MFEDGDLSYAGSKQGQEKAEEKKEVSPIEKKYSNEQYLSINTIIQQSEQARLKREKDKKLLNDDMDLSFDSAAL